MIATELSPRPRPSPLVGDDDGAILPLIAGYLVLGLALVLLCVNVLSLYLAQRRLDALADAAALAGADGFTVELRGDDPIATLSDDGVWHQAQAIVAVSPQPASLSRAHTPDGVTAEVTVVTRWEPVLVGLFVPEGVSLASTASSRTEFR